MAVAIHVPRVNNNDDEVKIVAINVNVGERVAKGAVLASVETDKAVLDVEAPGDGYVLTVLGALDETVTVGAVLMWLGKAVDEPVPVAASVPSAPHEASTSAAPTAKALMLLKRHGIAESDVPVSGSRLTTTDVEQFLATSGRANASAPTGSSPQRAIILPEESGQTRILRSEERGMIQTVTWSRDHAVPGYIELEYDPLHWDTYAKSFGDRHRLLLSPLLPLMAWRLVSLARANPLINATIVGDARYEYDQVNLGFTIQVGETLYLAVMRNAAAKDEAGFVNALGDLQRRATARKLVPEEVRGATISFSSMARWKVSRHLPVLPPHTSLIAAHAVSASGTHVLGATYDHRVMSGFQVVTTLRRLAEPNDRNV